MPANATATITRPYEPATALLRVVLGAGVQPPPRSELEQLLLEQALRCLADCHRWLEQLAAVRPDQRPAQSPGRPATAMAEPPPWAAYAAIADLPAAGARTPVSHAVAADLCIRALGQGDLSGAAELARWTVRLVAQGRDASSFEACQRAATTLVATGLLAEAQAALELASDADGAGRDAAPTLGELHARVSYARGRWDDALRQAPATASHARAEIARRRGDLKAWEAALPDASIPSDTRDHLGEQARGHGLLAAARGDTAGALEQLEAWWELRQSRLWVHGVEAAVEPVRVLLDAGETAWACEVGQAAADVGARSGIPGPTTAGLLARGLATESLQDLLDAVEVSQDSDRPIDHADACVAAATALGSADRRDDAIRLLRTAEPAFATVAATADLARTRAAMRALGLRRGVTGPRRRPRTGWDALTDMEQKVAGLVAEGLTNGDIGRRLYVSRRTVETHVSHIFTKLGLSSRAQLAAAVGRHTASEAA